MSIGLSISWTAGLSVRQHESKSGKTSFLCIFCIHVGVWGVDGCWTLLPIQAIHPQGYCDLASLVVYVSVLGRELGRNNIVTPRHLFFLFFQEFNYFSSYSFFSSFFPFFYSFILSCIHSFVHAFIHSFIDLSNISPHQKKKKCLNNRLHFKKALWIIFIYHLWWQWLP